MSGFGLREQWEGRRKIGKGWRDSAFLHQLSLNGSLLLAENHDDAWRRVMAKQLRFSKNTTWETMVDILRRLPASDARRFLWLASYRWWEQQFRAYAVVLLAATKAGRYELATSPEMVVAQAVLEMRAAQLQDLSWCHSDQSPEFIPVFEEEQKARPGKRRRRR